MYLSVGMISRQKLRLLPYFAIGSVEVSDRFGDITTSRGVEMFVILWQSLRDAVSSPGLISRCELVLKVRFGQQ